jgi:hypothetical protein
MAWHGRCSGSDARLSHHPHIAAHHIHEYQVDIRWFSVPSRRFRHMDEDGKN